MVYKQFVVMNIRTERQKISELASQERVVYDFRSSGGEEVSFCLIVAGCVGEEHYRKQYEVIRQYLLPGVRISCRIAYTRREEYFSMGMSSFAVLGEGSLGISEWVDTPGVIEFYGDAHIPFSAPGGKIKHVRQPGESEMILAWLHRMPFLLRVFRNLWRSFSSWWRPIWLMH